MKPTIKTLSFTGILLLLLAGCNLPANPNQSSLAAADNYPGALLVTADPNASPTPTPFLPQASGNATPAAGPTQPSGEIQPTQSYGPTPTPTTVPLIDRYPRPDGQVNILILGSDWRPNAGYRTDTILLLSVNTKTGSAALISFPRDLYVDIPGWEMQRINTAQAHGGFSLTQATFEENFGVHPDHYIMTNFQGFKGIIDTLGGINVYATRSLSDTCDLPQAVHGYCTVSPGWITMNGATALWYIRARHTTSDFDRTRREQEVIQAIFTKLLSLNALSRVPEIYNLFRSSVETDLSLTDILALAPVAARFTGLSALKRYSITPDLAPGWITPEGADVLIPNIPVIFDKIIAPACYGQ